MTRKSWAPLLLFSTILFPIELKAALGHKPDFNSTQVVSIEVRIPSVEGSFDTKYGSGFFVSGNGYILTAAHLFPPLRFSGDWAALRPEIMITTYFGGRVKNHVDSTALIYVDHQLNLALLKTRPSPEDIKGLKMSTDKHELMPGEIHALLAGVGHGRRVVVRKAILDSNHNFMNGNNGFPGLNISGLQDGDSGSPLIRDSSVVGVLIDDTHSVHSPTMVPITRAVSLLLLSGHFSLIPQDKVKNGAFLSDELNVLPSQQDNIDKLISQEILKDIEEPLLFHSREGSNDSLVFSFSMRFLDHGIRPDVTEILIYPALNEDGLIGADGQVGSFRFDIPIDRSKQSVRQRFTQRLEEHLSVWNKELRDPVLLEQVTGFHAQVTAIWFDIRSNPIKRKVMIPTSEYHDYIRPPAPQ